MTDPQTTLEGLLRFAVEQRGIDDPTLAEMFTSALLMVAQGRGKWLIDTPVALTEDFEPCYVNRQRQYTPEQVVAFLSDLLEEAAPCQ